MSTRHSTIASGEALLSSPDKWGARDCYKIFLYFGICFVAVHELPNSIWDSELRKFTLVLGTIGIWRYSWWFIHALRAECYQRAVFPKIRSSANRRWLRGWRPHQVHFLITTYLEQRDTTERMIQSIVCEARNTGVPIKIWLGSGDTGDERIITNHLRRHASDLDIEIVIIRQNALGKRVAIGLVLRAMSRQGLHADDLVVFMDGDAILTPGMVERCAPIFADYPDLQALTTDEDVICIGPGWVNTWLKMRFAQRRLAMQSHALSGKVLTLTGRMSMFRAEYITSNGFIRTVESDHLEHWLWGRFRFLSGDDKSTWYYMLCKEAKLLYVPDVLVYTVERIEGSGIERMNQNFRRWSGNMLRNGGRAIALGPRKVGFFTWWCLVDQRLSMWTMLVSPIIACGVALIIDGSYLIAYIVWIACSRMLLSLSLYRYSREVFVSWPIFLYLNQLVTSLVKIHCLFRLAQQRWFNRGNQSTGYSLGWTDCVRNWMATYVTSVWVAALILSVTIYAEILHRPSWNSVTALLQPPDAIHSAVSRY